MVSDSYARSTGPLAKAGAAYMKIMNHSKKDDRLISVYSDIAKKTELHTHLKSDNGVMKMLLIDKGIEIGAMKEHALVRGGEHIMFMGLKEPFENGKIIPVTLLFEKAGEVNIEVVVDQKRKEKKHSQSHTH
ncbi:copper chaperone PCu(A)C [Paracoccaceae bacterium]|jgi:copper(I)-binding protein|nr:copper chaperone PCu(A)C [Paracoccaceae bacterium]MDG2249147.1 copper chaperone PCu(A)C [Paracoccaceae bacterium]